MLDVTDLSVSYLGTSVVAAVSEVSFRLEAGQILGVVGESGSGKSTSALAAVGYRSPKAVIKSGRSTLNGSDLLNIDRSSLREVWGRQVAYVAQNAGTALNPSLSIGAQMALPIAKHLGLRGAAAKDRCLELLHAVHLDGTDVYDRYPHQFSGGQQQRIVLALALSCDARVLILDEPTTGLDVTTQAQISALIRQLVVERRIAALYVSHDLALLSRLADRLCVMYGGRVVEFGASEVVVARPSHPYTRALLAAVPRVDRRHHLMGIPGEPPDQVVADACGFAPRCRFAVEACTTSAIALTTTGPNRGVRCIRHAELGESASVSALNVQTSQASVRERRPAVLEIRELHCSHTDGRRSVAAVKGLSICFDEGETVGIVGESGSGKTTILRAIAGVHMGPLGGSITFRGESLAFSANQRSREQRRALQLVFQDPGSSLNPRHTVGKVLTRAIRLLGDDVPRSDEEDRARSLLRQVKLSDRFLHRYPWELSGGQQQRVAIARAFVGRPAVLLCDEITSSLDVSVQATIIDLLQELAEGHRTTVVFVSHDLAVVRSVASRIIVMRDGEVCEEGASEQIISRPQHPYTRELLAAVPSLRSRQTKALAPGGPDVGAGG